MQAQKTRICVIDGLGGGIGSVIIKRLKEVYQEEHEVIALGINVLATAQMLKARANQGASGGQDGPNCGYNFRDDLHCPGACHAG